ncbi:hypothetical protein [Pseudomonas fluorescens]|uniref:hypothetical protein n=1 Tax=Pseudomonas fluorescens TaxID=294 RepID=UPI0006420B3D|nr:hypothetical protein [Pseudomonas fluorescens]
MIDSVSGLPASLNELITTINRDAIDYLDRESDVKRLSDALSQGDHLMAEIWATSIIKRQQACRHTQAHGLPAGLQALIDQVNAEQIDYRDRESDVKRLDDALSQSDHSMAEIWANSIIKRQQACRHTQAHGLPAGLQALIDQVNAEQIDYRDRESDVKRLNDALSQSDHSMAEIWANSIVTRQRNIHSQGLR